MEVVKALTVNRLQLMSDYSRRVLRPVFREEMRHVEKRWRRLYRKAQRLARREAVLLSDTDRQRLTEVLEQSGALATVYQFKLRLHEIWEQKAASHGARLEALRQWCAQAEASNIQTLQEFVHMIRRYQLTSSH
jgi:stearoyl-CoA desaturase (delta-9 desaturase)